MDRHRKDKPKPSDNIPKSKPSSSKQRDRKSKERPDVNEDIKETTPKKTTSPKSKSIDTQEAVPPKLSAPSISPLILQPDLIDDSQTSLLDQSPQALGRPPRQISHVAFDIIPPHEQRSAPCINSVAQMAESIMRASIELDKRDTSSKRAKARKKKSDALRKSTSDGTGPRIPEKTDIINNDQGVEQANNTIYPQFTPNSLIDKKQQQIGKTKTIPQAKKKESLNNKQQTNYKITKRSK